MAVALNPTKTLYSSSNSTTVENKKNAISQFQSLTNPSSSFDNNNNLTNNNNNNSSMMFSSYADSPSRARRSARVASLSPSKFTPLISNSSLESNLMSFPSGTSSASSSSNSFMPASPSRKYSLRGHRGEVSIDEITMNDIDVNESNTKNNSMYPSLHDHLYNNPDNTNINSSNSRLRTNPDRKHPTLDFRPTNLNTPSTNSVNLLNSNSSNRNPVMSKSSGITPSVKQINIQGTPSHKVLESLVSRGDFEEIAKATPLGGFYNRKNTVENLEKASLDSSLVTRTGNPSIRETKSRIQVIQSQNQTKTTENTKMNMNYNSSNSNSKDPTTTPQKQILQNNSVDNENSNSDQTVKIVRTLRNRSIIASPIPTATKRGTYTYNSNNIHNANSTDSSNYHHINFNNQQNTFLIYFAEISTFFKKHQKNLLAYSLITLFILATAYHIYEGLSTDYTGGIDNDKILNANRSKDVLQINESEFSILKDKNKLKEEEEVKETKNDFKIDLEEIKKLIEIKFLEQQQLNLHTKEDNGSNDLKLIIEQGQRIESLEKNLQEQITTRQDLTSNNNNNDNKEEIIQSAVAELQRRALESVELAVKGFENKFQALEERIIDEVRKKSNFQNNHNDNDQSTDNKRTRDYTEKARVIRSLTTSPVLSKFKGKGKGNTSPENCLNPLINEAFLFSGNRGKLAIKLPHPSDNENLFVSLEHPLLVPDRSCVPRDFEVWALNSVTLKERDSPILLFRGTYDLSGPSLQTFELLSNRLKKGRQQNSDLLVLQIRVRNNYGNDRFTCLHRLKIHSIFD